MQHIQIWYNFINICYISCFFRFREFLEKSNLELQVHEITCFYARKVDIHSTYANSRPCARKHPISRTFPSRTLTFETVRNRF